MTSAIARGARLSRDTLNGFLSSNTASFIEGSKIYPENNAALTRLLHSLGLDPNVRVRVLTPIGRDSNESSYVFVCWEWNYVLYAKEIGTALSGRGLPTGFKEAVQKIQKDATLGIWCVSLTDEWGRMGEELADSVWTYLTKRLYVWHEALRQTARFSLSWKGANDSLQRVYTCGFDGQQFQNLQQLQEHTWSAHNLPRGSMPCA